MQVLSRLHGFLFFMKKNKIIFYEVDDFSTSKAADIINSLGFISCSQKFVGQYVGYKFFIRVRSEDEDDIDFLHNMFGGYRSEQEKEGKIYYWFNAQDKRAIMILELVRDELEKDQELVDSMIKLAKILYRGTRKKLTDEQKQERVDLFNQIKSKYRKFKPETDNSGVLTESGEHQDTTENDIDL